ncbi:MAG TPA: hypothetical protein VF174_01940 [Micromonosporaceae bacterium]
MGGKLIVQDEQFEKLRVFLTWTPDTIRPVAQLVRTVALLCRLLRHEVREWERLRDTYPVHERRASAGCIRAAAIAG